jgi:site-specific DNA-methyltransferase (adenine-specific)
MAGISKADGRGRFFTTGKKWAHKMSVKLLNIDCMEYMATLPDKAFDLAIVDPPYGIGNWIPNNVAKNRMPLEKAKKLKPRFEAVSWNDTAPNSGYFDEIRRISQRQIIWGANYYNCFAEGGSALVWYKRMGNPQFSQCEIASLSWGKKVDYVHIDWQSGFARDAIEQVIHPCQKPVSLYAWQLEHYAKPGQRILDTHLGSGSSAIAAHYFGVDFVGCELDPDYYKAACERFDRETRQQSFEL